MKWQYLTAVAAAAAAVTASIAVPQLANASSSNPTFVVTELSGNYSAAASDLVALGLANISPTTSVSCAATGHHGHNQAAALLGLPTPIGTVGVATSDCTTVRGNEDVEPSATAEADIAAVSLFGGKVSIKAISSRCTTGPGAFGEPTATVGSTIASLTTDANYVRNGSGALVIPGIATVAVDVNSSTNHNGLVTDTTDAVVITLLSALKGVPAQTIVLGSCSITGHQFED